ncbi:MAG: LamG domain protein, partial [Myxococcales bacterium]|nr:LamG domain protein [Myxococcales bacterium]
MNMKTAWRARCRLTVFLFVALASQGAEAAVCGGGTTTCGPATSVTYNGTALTFYGSSTNGTVRSEIWYMTAPAAGTQNVVVTAANATDVTATSMSFTGVDQTTPLGTLVSALGTGTTATVTANTAVGEPVFDTLGAVGTTTPTVGPAQTVRQTNNTSIGLHHLVIGSSTAAGQSTPVTMSWTIPSADWALAAVPIKASTALTGLGVSSFTAVWAANNVLLAWQAGYEPDSIGFFLYRSDGGDNWIQLNADLIPGAALRGTDPSFSWTDAAPDPKGPMTYWLKDVKSDGSFRWSGPAIPSAPGAMAQSPIIPQASAVDAGASRPPAGSTTMGQGGCALLDHAPPGRGLQVILMLGLVASVRRRKHRLAMSALFLAALLSTQLWTAPSATAAGGVSVDATATGTGAIDLTFAHTMGAGANGLLVVGVVVSIGCPATATDAGNCGGCGLTCSSSVAPSLDSGLLGLWHFAEGTGATSLDSSGTGNTAVLTNGPKWTAGYTGNGLQFNGVSSYVEAPVGAWFGGNNPLTASAWVYATSGTNGPVFGVTSTKPPGGWNMPFLSILGSTVYGWIWNVGAGNTPISATVSLDAWHHLAITYTPGTGEIFYVDGATVGSKAGTYSPSGAFDYWSTDMPASRIAGMNAYLVGRIDEVRAYNRVLSAAEISALATARLSCAGGTCAACPMGQTSCSGSCVTTTGTDVFNCGGCGVMCNTAAGET